LSEKTSIGVHAASITMLNKTTKVDYQYQSPGNSTPTEISAYTTENTR